MRMIGRREKIKSMLQKQPFVSLHELESLFPGVSSMTLRRDIEYFEQTGEAIKVRGGARSMKFITTSEEDAFSKRLTENRNAKEKIATCAVSFIETGRSIFLDSGTTILTLATLLPDERFTVTTTGPNVAVEIAKKSHPIVNIVGGMLNRDNISLAGNQAMRFLDDINIDVAFLVPSGFSESGFTCGNYTECELKKLVVSKSRRVIVLADTSKCGKMLPYTVCGIGDVSAIISEAELPAQIREIAAANKVEMITAV